MVVKFYIRTGFALNTFSDFLPLEVAQEPNTTKDGSPLRGEAYVVINEHFNRINEKVSAYIKEQSHQAAVITATHNYRP